MLKTAPIVVGIDGSAGSAAALRWAAGEARRTHTRLVAVHVHDHAAAWGEPPSAAASERTDVRERALSWVLSALDPTGWKVRIEIDIAFGSPAPALVAAAKSAKMLVLGLNCPQTPSPVVEYCRDNATCHTVVIDGSDQHTRLARHHTRPPAHSAH